MIAKLAAVISGLLLLSSGQPGGVSLAADPESPAFEVVAEPQGAVPILPLPDLPSGAGFIAEPENPSQVRFVAEPEYPDLVYFLPALTQPGGSPATGP